MHQLTNMMSMISNVFLDSSVFIEPLRNNRVAFYKYIVSNEQYNCCINAIVVSEYLYKYLGLQNVGSPRSVESRGEIADTLQPYFINNVLLQYEYLENNASIVSLVPRLMSTYNLLPNDAIILGTCILHNIKFLATHDSDFDVAAPAEGIKLLKDNF